MTELLPLEIYKQAAEINDVAADQLEKGGWCQEAGRLASGERCLINSMAYAMELVLERSTDFVMASPPMQTAIDAVVTQTNDPATIMTHSIVDWNDTHGRQKEEVVGVLRAAAQTLREKADQL